jgi:tripartite-type tricarboxylate transporter receptor subunit TctC
MLRTRAKGETGKKPRKNGGNMRRLLVGGLVLGAVFLAWAQPAGAQTVEQFYRGKTVKFIVGSNTGGSYDTYSRLLAQFMGRHIPGNPTLVVENMPGASGVKSAQYIAEIAPKDGTVIGMFNQSMPQRQMLEPDQVHFDLAKFSWLGAMNTSTTVFIAWHASGVKTLEDAKKKEVVMGALSATGGNSVYPLLINAFLGTRFKVVLGYQGGNTIQLAMERGEVDGRAAVVWSGLKAGWPHWIAEKKINVLLQTGLQKEKDLPDVPLLLDLAKNPEEKAIFRFVSSDSATGFPVTAPPGVPADRLAALRKAFSDTMKDPEFLKIATERKLEIEPSSGEEVKKVVDDLISTPKDVIAKIKQGLAAAEKQAEEATKANKK